MDQSKDTQVQSAKPRPILYMVAGPKPHVIYNLTQQWAISHLDCEVVVLKEPMELFRLKSPSKQALIIYSLDKKEDLVEIAKAVNELSAREWQWTTQILVLSTLSHPRVFQLLRKLNCSVIDSTETSLRAIKIKIQKQIQLLELSLSGQVPAFLTQIDESSRKSAPFKILWEPPLVLESDFWIIPQDRFIYRAHEKWIFVLIGPSKWKGQWQNSSEGESKLWKWVVASEKEEPTGAWFFRGLKPKFAAGRWTFMGTNPQLTWVPTDEAPPMTKFRTISHEEVQLAPNSAFSIRFLPEPEKDDINLEDAGKEELPKNSNFMRIVETEIIYEFLQSAKRKKAQTSLWIQKKSGRWQGSFASFDPKDMVIKIRATSEENNESLLNSLKTSTNSLVMGNFLIPEGSVFFTADHLETDKTKEHWLIRPQKIFYHVQRRKHSRTPIVDNQSISGFSQGMKISIHDISLGGLGIKNMDLASFTLQEGQILDFNIFIYTWKINVKGEVRWIKKHQLENGTTTFDAGIMFHKMPVDDFEMLGIFIFEQDIETFYEDEETN